MRRRAAAVFALLLAICACAGAAVAAASTLTATTAKPASSALDYLLHHELADGGFPLQPGQGASTMSSGWAAMAIGAAARAGLISSGNDAGTAAITYLERTVKQEAGAGSIERTVLGLRALGQPVTAVNGVDLLTRLEHLTGTDGSVQGKTNLTTWAILALRSAGVAVPATTVRWLERQQDGDGGFNFATGSRSATSDPDDTGAVLEALAAAGAVGADAHGVTRAVAYLRRDQNRDGGFGSPLGSPSNSESTAWAIQGLIAVDLNPATFHRAGGQSATHYLVTMTGAGGEIAYAKGVAQTPVWTTAEVLPALIGQAYPVTSSPRTVPHSSGHADGGAPAAGTPLAGSGDTLRHVTPDVPLSVGRLIVALHSPL